MTDSQIKYQNCSERYGDIVDNVTISNYLQLNPTGQFKESEGVIFELLPDGVWERVAVVLTPAADPHDYLTITLTGRPPVRINKSEWPVIASAKDWQGQYETLTSRSWFMTVRQHADGRVIVYGRYETHWQGERDRRAGVLVGAGGDIPAAIHEVVETLGGGILLEQECVASLPAVQL